MMIIEESMSNGSLDSFLRVSVCSGLEIYRYHATGWESQNKDMMIVSRCSSYCNN